MKSRLLFLSISFILCQLETSFTKAGIEDTEPRWSVRAAETAISNNFYSKVLDYVDATAIKGFRNLWLATGNDSYLQYISDLVDASLSFYESLASEDYHDIDPVNGGSLVLFMYSQTGELKYQTASDSILKFLKAFPRSADGGLFHKDLPRMQVDDLYMGSPFLAEYGYIFNQPEEYTDAARQAILMEKHTRDSVTGLYYHVWYETAYNNFEAGCSPIFWGRGVGWVAMALVDMLDYMPVEYSGRDSVVAVFQRLAEAISNVQDETTGVWWQILDQGGKAGNFLESSGSGMFVYALAKGIRLGYIDESYWPLVEKGYKGMLNEFVRVNEDSSITITDVCPGQSPGVDYSSYLHGTYENGHGFGPFIKASLEIELRGVLPTGLQALAVSGNKVNLYWIDNSDNEEGFRLERKSGGDFVEIAVIQANTVSYQDTALLPLTTYTYRIRSFRGDTCSMYSDSIIVITLGENGAPAYASQPDPTDGSKSVSITPVISWLPGDASTSHDIYLGTSDPPPFFRNQTDSIFSPDTLDPYTTYYWRVNELNSSGTTVGAIWSFITGGKPGLVAHWNMDEHSGSVLHDVSGYGNDGTLVNMSDEAWVPGISGNALQFDGIDDYILVPHSQSIDFADQDMTISFWLKQSVTDKSMTYIIKGTHEDPGTGKRYEVNFDETRDFIRFIIDDNLAGPMDMNIFQEWQFDPAEWIHITAIRLTTNDMLLVFTNAKLTGAAFDSIGDISQDEDLYIAVSPDEENSNFKGLLDDIRIYNYVLSTEEIESIYREGIPTSVSSKFSDISEFKFENHPNPFKEKTTILYSLSRKEKIKISLYDLLGKEVKVIIDQVVQEGRHAIVFDANELITGTYICKLQTEYGMKTIRMIRIR